LAQRSRKRRRAAAAPRPHNGAKTQPPAAGPRPHNQAQTPPAAPEDPAQFPGTIGGWRVERPMTRSQRRDAEVRAGLTPLAQGERPGAIIASTLISGLIGVGQLIAFFAGLKIHGKTPAASGTILFCLVMIVCAGGLWRLWYGAVLGFMALLAIVATLFSLYLIEASNLLGLFVALIVIGGSGYLFFKLVRVLSRIQMPRYPGR
jgi:hypothetical protein